MRRNTIGWLTLCGILLLPRCAVSPVTGTGGSSETVNAKLLIADTTVSLAVDDNDAGVLTMRIFSPDYRPYEKRGMADSVATSAVTDPIWNAPAPGSYNILLSAATKNVSCFIRNVSFEHGVRDTIQCVLNAPRKLVGNIVAPDSTTVAEPFMVAIYGTPFVALSDTAGHFGINAVPPGSYSITIRSLAKRLFVPSSTYSITSEMFDKSMTVRMILP